MYLTVRSEIVKRGMTFKRFAERIGKTSAWLSNKLTGKVAITLDDALLIKKALGTDMPLEKLFERTEKSW